ncbi:hypothetical protein KOM00_00040 [Geomonas sp. Red69]|uniref:tRNA(Ile2) 2-agmatinylcytidine synthetase n=1 Tax=Geomonas diazotrophica TaxID=2843197 RepID=A0ABX8JHR2_9BACT|nr:MULTISPECIES: hypothetical protein [Geomonas]MBU5635119.1 hypothetical protein [Geomonas diazotrophica]QWV97833.1 hypothetical protein KP005_00615 [Geomonas nitrogeniifigens]QXE86973.1 hypothetical protein KP003_00760 [Geomonas nitrogeniifigens]
MPVRVLIAIDDTDNSVSRGTGEIASLIADAIDQNGWGVAGFISRHQLLVHPDIPYTSHNSAMCFPVDMPQEYLEPLVSFACGFLERECAEGSDPGLCVAVPEQVPVAADLIAFGRRAKQEVITKGEALALAGRLGVHLSEHGGTGHGVIGALAGVGLRLWGSDGRMRGSLAGVRPGQLLTVRELLAQPDVDAVSCADGSTAGLEELVSIGDKPKTVLRDGASVLLVRPADPSIGTAWETLPRRLLREY